MFNSFFHSEFSAKENYNCLDIKCESPTSPNFSVSNKTISNILANIDTTKTRGPNGLAPGFYQRCGKQMSNILNKLFKNIKRIRKMPTSWKTAAVTPIHKKNDPKDVENYRPISLLNIDSKIFEKCMYSPLYEHFKDHLFINQHGFVKKRSDMSNMLRFLNRIYKALDENPHDEIIAFYADFSKAFDKVPLKLLLRKLKDIGVGGCLLEIIYDYLRNRRQFVRVDFYTSTVLEITSGVPQGSLLGPLLFFVFINDLHEVLRFSDPSIFADDLKILSVGRKQDEIQLDLNKIEVRVGQNNMELAFEICAQINLRGVDINLFLNGNRVPQPESIKDLGIHILGDLSWNTHLTKRLKKANKLLYSLRRNVAFNVNTFVKLGLYKSILLPVLTYGCHCVNFLRKDLQKLEFFQKKAAKWICGKHCQKYTDQLRMLKILPLPMFLQTNDLLLLSKLCTDYEHHSITLPTANNTLDRRLEPFKLPKTRTEKRRGEFVFRTTRVANRIDHLVNFRIEEGLNQRITNLMLEILQ